MFFQKIIIKSNIKISHIKWTENEYDEIELEPENNLFILYRKTDNICYDNIKLYYELLQISNTFKFQMSNKYKHEIIIMIIYEDDKYKLYIDDKNIDINA